MKHLLWLAILLAGCNSDSNNNSTDTSGTSDPLPTTYQTDDPRLEVVGGYVSFDLTGTADGDSIEATIIMTRLSDRVSGDKIYRTIEQFFSYTILGGNSGSSIITSWTWDEDGSTAGFFYDSGVRCDPTSAAEFSDTVYIGQAGFLASFDCSDGSTVSWNYEVKRSDLNEQWGEIIVYGEEEYFPEESWRLSEESWTETHRHISTDGTTQVLEMRSGYDRTVVDLTS